MIASVTPPSFARFCAPALLALFGLAASPALAQTAPDPVSREIVQPLPPQAAADLAAALKRLGANPSDGDALVQAGWSALKLNNVESATGFFSRAQELPATKGDALAGLAAVQVERKHPVEALKLFDEADQFGAKLGVHASERALAYDLVGDNARAQQFYRASLAAAPDDEITRRLALSQAIGGDQAAADATLLPQLQHRDLAAYRTRAFALAALGKTEEAVSIANAVMSASLAGRIAPYLRYMPKLTRAQQAAAGIFGHFPEADAIGHDDPRIAEYTAAAQPAGAKLASIDARLTPSGKTLGEKPPAKAAPLPAPAPAPAPAPVTAPAPAPAKAAAAQATPAAPPAGASVVLAKGELPPLKPAEAPRPAAQPGWELPPAKPSISQASPAQTAAAQKPPVQTPPVPAPPVQTPTGSSGPGSSGPGAGRSGQCVACSAGGRGQPARSGASVGSLCRFQPRAWQDRARAGSGRCDGDQAAAR